MDFFINQIVIHKQSYRCKLSYDKATLFIPFSEFFIYALLIHKTAAIDGALVQVEGRLVQVQEMLVVESLGFGGKDKLLKLKISWVKMS
ncbi:hypothetical protein [Photobacterium atrarenae]|uniref:Uncharacterized protein n=1 Tax=Photobacterium atrarenae TaxID=865757 RepID=A0ABY5GNP7_9GAMM|nr:hypothetical protein [Photobacterium atrarenae]UTV30979.1 hypothetical protein NNL38_24545 [Photobacterium atrarenae]